MPSIINELRTVMPRSFRVVSVSAFVRYEVSENLGSSFFLSSMFNEIFFWQIRSSLQDKQSNKIITLNDINQKKGENVRIFWCFIFRDPNFQRQFPLESVQCRASDSTTRNGHVHYLNKSLEMNNSIQRLNQDSAD